MVEGTCFLTEGVGSCGGRLGERLGGRDASEGASIDGFFLITAGTCDVSEGASTGDSGVEGASTGDSGVEGASTDSEDPSTF